VIAGLALAAAVVGAVVVATHTGGSSGADLLTSVPGPTGSLTPSQAAAAKAAAEPMATTTSTSSASGGVVSLVTIGDLPKNHRMFRVYSARRDLSNTGELKWRGDDGHAVGDAFCTQKYSFNPGTPAVVRPTMLLCWRTSAARSAYTLTVSVDTPPSEHDAVGYLDEAWSKLG
jgi:hypothetical protein